MPRSSLEGVLIEGEPTSQALQYPHQALPIIIHLAALVIIVILIIISELVHVVAALCQIVSFAMVRAMLHTHFHKPSSSSSSSSKTTATPAASSKPSFVRTVSSSQAMQTRRRACDALQQFEGLPVPHPQHLHQSR